MLLTAMKRSEADVSNTSILRSVFKMQNASSRYSFMDQYSLTRFYIVSVSDKILYGFIIRTSLFEINYFY